MKDKKQSANGPYEYRGIVHQVGKTQTFPSGFAKRTLVLVQDPSEKYPSYAAFDFTKSKCEGATDRTRLLDNLRAGMEVKVTFYLDANESQKARGSWFVSAHGMEVYNADGSAIEARRAYAIPLSSAGGGDGKEDDGGLPF